jgi:hypothetical protein
MSILLSLLTNVPFKLRLFAGVQLPRTAMQKKYQHAQRNTRVNLTKGKNCRKLTLSTFPFTVGIDRINAILYTFNATYQNIPNYARLSMQK